MGKFTDWAAPTLAADPTWADARAAFVADALMARSAFARRRLVPPVPPGDAEWGKLRAPTLLLFGDREVIFDPKAAAEKMARVAPQVQVEVLPAESHDLFVVAAPEVSRRVIAFLETRS